MALSKKGNAARGDVKFILSIKITAMYITMQQQTTLSRICYASLPTVVSAVMD
jgi:hypothetical protein